MNKENKSLKQNKIWKAIDKRKEKKNWALSEY